jgi:hypothetical protein
MVGIFIGWFSTFFFLIENSQVNKMATSTETRVQKKVFSVSGLKIFGGELELFVCIQ